MVRKVVEIKSEDGLRARAAALFVQTASNYQSLITIERENKKINAKSIMGVLSLGVVQGDDIQLTANGPDEQEAVAALIELVSKA